MNPLSQKHILQGIWKQLPEGEKAPVFKNLSKVNKEIRKKVKETVTELAISYLQNNKSDDLAQLPICLLDDDQMGDLPTRIGLFLFDNDLGKKFYFLPFKKFDEANQKALLMKYAKQKPIGVFLLVKRIGNVSQSVKEELAKNAVKDNLNTALHCANKFDLPYETVHEIFEPYIRHNPYHKTTLERVLKGFSISK